MEKENVIELMDDLQEHDCETTLTFASYIISDAFGDHYKLEFPLECAKRGLRCFLHTPKLMYLVIKKSIWCELT